jgi:EmrB/QacA subfamily drug resistance transporter
MQERLDRRTILALAAMAISVLVVANDFTAMSVALTTIERDLNADLSTVQWVINAYALVFGVLIVTGGRLADMLGRRRVFVLGAGVFAGFSVLGGLAPGAVWLIACRAAMGIGGAMMWPAILGMTYAVLPEAKAGLAGGLILGAAGFGNALGPLLGGLLTDALSWRWILFVNLPVAAFAIFVTLHAIEPDRGQQRLRLDYTGVATISLGLLAALVALDQSSQWGWTDARVVGAMATAVALLCAFLVAERHAGEAALVPRDVIANRNFASACLAVLLLSAVFFATLLYLPQFMSKDLGYQPLRAGAGLLPMMATFAIVSFVAGRFYEQFGPKVMVSLGAAFITAGIVLLSRLSVGDAYAALVPGMVVLGVGFGVFYSSVTTAGVTALDPARASLAGAIVYMFQIAGGSVGLGVNTALVAANTTNTAGHLVSGIRTAFTVDAILAAAGLIVAVLFIGGSTTPDAIRAHRPHLHRAHL